MNVNKRIRKCIGWKEDSCGNCQFEGYWEQDIGSGRGVSPLQYTPWEKIDGKTVPKTYGILCYPWGENFNGEFPSFGL